MQFCHGAGLSDGKVSETARARVRDTDRFTRREGTVKLSALRVARNSLGDRGVQGIPPLQ